MITFPKTFMVAAIATAVATAEERLPSTSVHALFGTEHRRALIASADSLEVALLVRVSPDSKLPSEYREEASVIVQDETKKRIADLLLTEATYNWPYRVMPDGSVRGLALGGFPTYHLRMKLQRGADRMLVTFSFFAHVVVEQDGVVVNTAFLGPRSDELLSICREIFPKSSALLLAENMRKRVKEYNKP